MDKKSEFNEALSALVEYATVNGSTITTADVKEYFKNIINNDDGYIAVYKYLSGINIKISDYHCETDLPNTLPNGPETEEGKAFLNMYYEELERLSVDTSHIDALIKASMTGDAEAINKLTEIHLGLVVEIATQKTASPLRQSDLIGIGNVALFEAIRNYDGTVSDYKTYLSEYIRKEIDAAEIEEINSLRIFNHAADRANALSDATIELAKELDREATLEELCERLSLSEEEVRNVMKMSLEALKE